MAETKKTVFEVLNTVNVNDHTEVKDTGKTKLTYLSWAWAWAEVKKKFPDATYEIVKFDGIPYVFDEKTGYMVYTTVTIGGITHEMWLPVMDGNNRAMLNHPYEVQTKYNKFTVQAATMFDVNKTIMRCLTKNLAMFGLGLYIYAGEDLPEVSDEVVQAAPAKTEKESSKPKTESTAEKTAEEKTESTEEKSKEEKTERSPARQKLYDFIAKNGFTKADQKKIIDKCKLTRESSDEEFEIAIKYAEDMKAQKEREKRPDDYGVVPFEV